MSIQSVILSIHLILWCPLLLLPSVFISIRVFYNELVLCIEWPKYWSFCFSISPSNEYLGLIFFRIHYFDLLEVQVILKSLLQHHNLKASILLCPACFMVLLSHPYMTPGNSFDCMDLCQQSDVFAFEYTVKLCHMPLVTAAAAASLQACPTLCDPIDGSPPGSPVPGILQARTLERVATSFSNAWKWKVKVKSLSRVWLFETPWTVAHQAPPSMGFSRQEYWSGMPLPSPAISY